MICDGQFTDSRTGYSVIFDDDGRVAYAYLLNPKGELVADVWLYNRCKTPESPEWKNPDRMPFANSAAYSKDHTDFFGVEHISDVSVHWLAGEVIEAQINIRGNHFASLAEGDKPGWCCMAKKDGPLAKVLMSAKMRDILENKKNQLEGSLANEAELADLKAQLPSELLPDWYVSLLETYRLSGSIFSLDDELDQSEMGVDLKWLTPEQTIDEALNTYPGKSVIELGYLPIGSCLAGSGDPYFLNLRSKSSDPVLVRIPHAAASEGSYPEDEIELVCNTLSDFFEQAEIE